MFTIAGLAEAVSRNGALRYGETSFSQLVNDSLGRLSSLVFFAGLAATCFLILWAYSVGFAATLAAVTGIPAAIWGIALFLVTFHFIWRGSLNTPFAATLLLSIVGVALILALALLAFIQIDPANFNAATFPQGAFPSSVSLLFGVVSMAYFGHLAIGNSAQVVLRRDSSARSLIWGAVAAQASAILLYCLWVAAVNGALGPQGLSREPGTVLTPLAARLGPAVSAAGLLFALSMGLAVIHFSLRLYHLMREYLPIERQPILVLPQRQGRLILTNSWRKAARARGELRMGLTYLGLGEASNESPEKPARFYLDVQFEGHLYRTELAIKGQWEAEGLLERLHIVLLRKPRLALEILEARPEFVRLKISSSLRLGYEREEDKAIPNAADVFSQPDAERKVVTWMLREAVHGRTEVNLASVMTYTSMAQAEAQALMRRLGEQGFVREVEVNGEIRYRSALSTRRGRRLPKKVWRALDETKDHSTNAKAGFFQHGRGLVFSKVGRAVLSVSPVIAAFLLVEGLLLSGEASFSAPLNFLGVLVTPALGGFFPIWLLLANRSKGEMAPGVVYSFLGRPALLAGIALFYLVGLFLYGVVIWQNPFERAAALISGALLTALTISLARQGAFAPRVVVELRKEQGETPTGIFVVSSGGQAVKADVQLVYRDHEERRQAANGTITAFADLCALHVQLPKTPATELKVWVHAVTPAGSSEGLPAELRVSLGSEEKEFNLRLSAGQVVVPLNGGSCHLTISLPE